MKLVTVPVVQSFSRGIRNGVHTEGLRTYLQQLQAMILLNQSHFKKIINQKLHTQIPKLKNNGRYINMK